MRLARFPRRRYTPAPTSLHPLPRLSARLGGPELWIKRDDQLGLAGGGNKTRKLEFLVADALAQGADTLITTGAPQSNHCRLTLAAAACEGLACRLLVEERVPGSYAAGAVGNNLLFDLLGAERVEVVEAGSDLGARMRAMAEDAAGEGRTPYVIPGGGSNALGALGYAACAAELAAQAFDAGVTFDAVVCASGSGGTHAGLVAGSHAFGLDLPVRGVSVRAERATQEAKIHRLAEEVRTLLGTATPVPEEAVSVRDDQVGPGYSLPTDAMGEAVRIFAREESILLDPVYTGKAAAGLLAWLEEDGFGAGQRVAFVHTGGSPALHAYPEQVRSGSA